MTTWGFLPLAFALLWSPGVTSLPSLVPTRTVQLRRTNVLTARAWSTSTTAPTELDFSKPGQVAVTVVTVILFTAMFGFLVAKKKYGVQFHCHRVKKALGRRSRGHNIPHPPPPPTVVPKAEHYRPPVADNNPSYGKLDGWTPPPAPKEAPHHTIDIASYGNLTFSQLDGYSEEPPSRTRTSSEIPPPVNPTPATPSTPSPHPGQPQSSETWKQGTVTGPGTEGWK